LQGGKYPYVYVDGIYLRRNWGGVSANDKMQENAGQKM
jgi:transposase-like protein